MGSSQARHNLSGLLGQGQALRGATETRGFLPASPKSNLTHPSVRREGDRGRTAQQVAEHTTWGGQKQIANKREKSTLLLIKKWFPPKRPLCCPPDSLGFKATEAIYFPFYRLAVHRKRTNENQGNTCVKPLFSLPLPPPAFPSEFSVSLRTKTPRHNSPHLRQRLGLDFL